MAIAPILQKHLDRNVTYDVLTHDPTMSSTRTAQACHVSGDRLAKAIVLRHDGRYLIAVLPATHHVHLADLKTQIGDDVDLAGEDEIKRLFPDCAPSVTNWMSSSTTASRSSPTCISRAGITRRSFIWTRRNSPG